VAVVAATGILVSTAVAGATPAGASGQGSLTVKTVAVPMWLSGKAMRVHYLIDNADSQFFCEPAAVRLVWASAGGHWHHRYANVATTAGMAAGSFTIPGRTIWPGTLRYKVKVSQDCGMFMDGSTIYRGQSPSSGYSKTTIR
jgi:hypothetical protein